MSLVVYGFEASPPCRAVFLTMRALGLDFKLKPIDTKAGDTFTPEYLEKNPQHTVPMLQDGDFLLAESRAIMTYLVRKYALSSSLYPEDPEARALVDSRLYFDSGLFKSLRDVLRPLKYDSNLAQSKAAIPALLDNLKILEALLGKSEYAAGGQVTLADVSLVTSVSTVEAMGIDLSAMPRVRAWLNKMKQLPYYEANVTGVTMVGKLYKAALTAFAKEGQ